jgi:hypothetical protein
MLRRSADWTRLVVDQLLSQAGCFIPYIPAHRIVVLLGRFAQFVEKAVDGCAQ